MLGYHIIMLSSSVDGKQLSSVDRIQCILWNCHAFKLITYLELSSVDSKLHFKSIWHIVFQTLLENLFTTVLWRHPMSHDHQCKQLSYILSVEKLPHTPKGCLTDEHFITLVSIVLLQVVITFDRYSLLFSNHVYSQDSCIFSIHYSTKSNLSLKQLCKLRWWMYI